MPKAIEIYHARLSTIVPLDTTLQKLAIDVAVHSEKPAYFAADDSTIWSDAHGNRLLVPTKAICMYRILLGLTMLVAITTFASIRW